MLCRGRVGRREVIPGVVGGEDGAGVIHDAELIGQGVNGGADEAPRFLHRRLGALALGDFRRQRRIGLRQLRRPLDHPLLQFGVGGLQGQFDALFLHDVPG